MLNMCQILSLMAAAEGPVAEFSSFANFEEKKRKSNLLMSFPKTGNQMGSFGQIRKNSFFRFCRPILDIFGLTLLNAAARLVCRAPRYCRITPLLCELHWLPVRQRISFKILLFVFKVIHGFAPTYLRELVSIKRSGNYNLRSSSDGLLLATPSYIVYFK